MNQVMDIVKRNLISIICGVVALLAICAVFWPITGMFEDLQARAGKSKTQYDSLTSVLKKSRTLPELDPTSSEPKPLEQFPTEPIIAKGQAVQAEVETEAKAMLDAAVAINQKDHTLLEPESLPGGTAQARIPAMKFRTKYQEYMDVSDPSRRAESLPVKLMGAGMKPTDAEITAEQNRRREEIKTNDLAYDDRGRPMNQPQVDAKIAAEIPMVGDQMRLALASMIKVYIEPQTLDIQPQISVNPGLPPPSSAIFWAQLGIWIQEDICRSIADANGSAANVLDSTVKRVIKIEIPDEFAMLVSKQSNSPEEGFALAPSADLGGPITRNFAISPTGRSSNGLYDVVHFKLSLICDAERVPAFLTAISKNKFMTIFRTDVSTVDSGAEQLNGYYYGTRPVVMLSMEGEALFLREWLAPLMPDRIKRDLGIGAVPGMPQ